MRRVTWTFLSQHAQVIEYDGSRLVLGIATTGLANTFRQGNHAEVVRQALIETVALDVRVEGVALPAAQSTPELSPVSHAAGSQDVSDRPANLAARVNDRSEPRPPQDPQPTPPASQGPAASTSLPQPDDSRHTGAGPAADPDALASVDDEDVESDDAGQAVIERMLGGKVVGEPP